AVLAVAVTVAVLALPHLLGLLHQRVVYLLKEVTNVPLGGRDPVEEPPLHAVELLGARGLQRVVQRARAAVHVLLHLAQHLQLGERRDEPPLALLLLRLLSLLLLLLLLLLAPLELAVEPLAQRGQPLEHVALQSLRRAARVE